MAGMAGLQDAVVLVKDEIIFTISAIREKGYKHFAKPLAMTGTMLAVTYYMVYVHSRDRLQEVRSQLAAARATSTFADAYKDAVAKIRDVSTMMPQLTDRDGWLFNRAVETSQKQGISLGAIGNQVEINTPAFLVLSLPVGASTTYAQFGSWVAELENTPKLLKVTGFRIKKVELDKTTLAKENLGKCSVELEISTIIPKLRVSS